MALATTRPTFSFFPNNLNHPIKPPKPPSLLPISKPPSLLPISKPPKIYLHRKLRSVDLSQDDIPVSSDNQDVQEIDEETSTTTDQEETQTQKFDPRRLEEKFAVLNTGIYECRSCGYRYNESAGDPSYPIPPGLQFGQLPEDWRCPTCGAAKSFFVSKSVEIAGFAQNQQFGLGGNTLTSGQKALLIYGSLLLAFALFLSGYFLQ